jgi:ABC-type glycerol-3-phosphate transport system substrate-binding protein
METPGFSDIIEGFKKSVAKEYSNLTIRFTNFGTYADYEKNLLNVIADGNSPDIFLVPSDGGKLLESKTDFLPESVIDINDFAKRFPQFDDLIVREKQTDDAKDLVQYLKGVPLGYESLGLFYNLKLVRQRIPTLWADLDQKIQSSDSGAGDEEKPQYSLIGLGLGSRYIPDAPDIFALFLAQNKLSSIDKLDDSAAVSALDTYRAYAQAENGGISHLVPEMNDLHLTAVDMFVRGKIGILVGYPSLLREIAFAMKRSGSTSFSSSMLRTSEIPQITDNGQNAVNLMRYCTFAVSKNAKNSLLAARFVAYLSTKEAQESFMKHYPYYLSALQELEEKQIGEPILPEGTISFKNAKYGAFILSKGSYVSFDK